jgi:hypothetical protein
MTTYTVENKPVTIKSIAYHRNGISGEGFYLVHFLWNGHAMQAMVFHTKTCCGVIDVQDPKECWRGDHFEHVLRQAIMDDNKRFPNARKCTMGEFFGWDDK